MTTESSACDKGGFTIVWRIENFSHCLVKKGSCLESPAIKIPKYSCSWIVNFYPRGINTALVECSFQKFSGDQKPIIDCLFCACTSKEEVLYKKETLNIIYLANRYESKNIAKFERNLLDRLPDDTLIIHCHVRDHNSDRSEDPVNCFVRTIVNIQRQVFYWRIDKFSTLQLKEEIVYQLLPVKDRKPSLIFTLSLVGTNLDDASVQISLKIEGVNNETFFTCVLFVMSPKGTAQKYMRDEYVLASGTHLKMFPFFLQRRELVAEDLSEDTLTIRGEVTFTGDYDSVEQVVHGIPASEATIVTATGSISPDRPSTALSADMLSLLEGSGPPSDFELRVEGRSFPVHQLVLGTRSAVFRAMFDNDMLEQSAKSAELTDLDADTAERLLKFAYADVEPPAGLPWGPLAGLYSAADKYQILALRKVCAKRLVHGLDTNNAPGILQLADRHRDSHLKEEVIDYLFRRGRAVLDSDQWKNLEMNDSQLAVNTLHRIFCEKVFAQPLELRNDQNQLNFMLAPNPI